MQISFDDKYCVRVILKKIIMQFWIIYFWIIAVLVVFTLLGRIYLYFRTDEVKFYDLVESAISLVAIAGLHGYAYQSPYLSPFFWQIVWILLLVTWLASLGGRKNREMINKIGVNKGVVVIMATTIIGIPTLVGLFSYAFLSSGLWDY